MEPIGRLDLVALGAEVALVVALVALLPTPARRRTTNLMLCLALGGLILLLFFWGLRFQGAVRLGAMHSWKIHHG